MLDFVRAGGDQDQLDDFLELVDPTPVAPINDRAARAAWAADAVAALA